MIKEAIAKLVERADLTEQEAYSCMNEVMSAEATPAQIGAYLTALRMKGETIAEITGSARLMRDKATKVKVAGVVVDTCGTGGDSSGTFNISTATAFVVAGAGLKVAKHGNRSITSKSGSADVLKSLGVNIEAEVERVEECLEVAGIGFLFAPLLHGAMKHAAPIRRELGIRSVFNVLGPLTNPAGAKRQVLGVYAPGLTEPLAAVLKNLGSERAFVVRGEDGLDEFTLTDATRVTELKDSRINTYFVRPEDVGLKRCAPKDLLGGTPDDNAKIILDILNDKGGPASDIVQLNASAAIVAGGLADDLKHGLDLAKQSIASGRALNKLDTLKKVTNG